MKYLIIGAGGIGGSIGAFMTEAKKDVTLIARGKHLEIIQQKGLTIETNRKGNYTVYPIKAADMEHYKEKPDVIFVCVKAYSLEEIIPFIARVSKNETIVIPLLNVYGTGGRMQDRLQNLLVTDGCIYIASEIKEPGTILQKGNIFRVLFGVRKQEDYRAELKQIVSDLKDSGIEGVLSEDIKRDALQKFSYVSPMAACGVYFNADAGEVQQQGLIRDTYIALMQEIEKIAAAMDIHFTVDIIKTNLAILDVLDVTASTSMQRDVKQGKESEIDGLVFEVVRLGKKLGINVPTYEKIAVKFGFSV